MPETANVPLEEMNYLFTNSPWVVVGTKKGDYVSHDLERRLAEEEEKRETGAAYYE